MVPNKKETTTELKPRAPIVSVMGHVDHGKTSILDVIRKTNVQAGEYGGITQHIGAYQISYNNRKITFIDTPGHEAFTQMRARGGRASDIVVLVVAAEEGVMPQTKEAIFHAKNAGVQIIVAINKIDKAGADVQKVKQELAQQSVLVEDWGGDILCIPLSAKTGEGIDKLLEALLAVSDILQLKADPSGELEAVIIESRLDRKKGVIVSCIVKNGTLTVGEKVTASGYDGKVKSLMTDTGENVKFAGPATPVEVLGFSEVPSVGDLIVRCGSELASLAVDANRVEIVGSEAKKTIAIILKADTQGTLEAVKGSLAGMVSSSVGASFALKFLHSSTGEINECDVSLAHSTKGLVLGFNVRLSPEISEMAEAQGVRVKTYKTIYDLIEDAKDFLEGTATQAEAKIKGRAQIQKLFKLPSGDVILGCKVLAGALKPGVRISIFDKDPADVTQEDTPLYTGSIKKLKRGKDDIGVAGKDTECGLLLKPVFVEAQSGMWVEVR